MKIGIYPGSFNPFHIGHKNIYDKACKLFDKVIIARGINPAKNNKIEELILPEGMKYFNFVGILTKQVLVVSLTNRVPLDNIFIIRGIRNSKDYEEQSIQDYWLKQTLDKYKSIYIECDSEYKNISSSTIRTLKELEQETKHLTI